MYAYTASPKALKRNPYLAGLSGMYDLKEMPLPLEKEEKKNFIWKAWFLAQDSVVDPHHFDVDPDPVPNPA